MRHRATVLAPRAQENRRWDANLGPVRKLHLRRQPQSLEPTDEIESEEPFLTDIKELRRRAREHIEQGAVTERYGADRETVIKLLNEALATEIVCVLRYKRHYFMATGHPRRGAVADEFLAARQRGAGACRPDRGAHHAARRRAELQPRGPATRSHAEYVEGERSIDMIREDLVAERIAIESYTRDDPLHRQRRSDDAAHAGGHPREGRGARRGHVQPARDALREPRRRVKGLRHADSGESTPAASSEGAAFPVRADTGARLALGASSP